MSGGSRLRYLLGTSKATLAVVPMLVAFGYATLPSLATWRGDGWWGLNHLSQAVPVAVVLTAFVAGWDAGAPSSGARALRDRVPAAGWRVHLTLLALPMAAATVPYLLGLGTLVVATATADGVVAPSAGLVVLAHLAMLALAASAGVGAGWLLTSPYAAVTATAGVAALLFWTLPGGGSLFAFPGTSGPVAEQVAPFSRYGVAALGLVLAAVLLALPALSRTAGRAVVLASLAAALGALGASSLAVSPELYAASGERPGRCLTTSVTVCVYPGYDRLLEPAGNELERFLAHAEERGVPRSAFPTRYEQGGNQRTPPGVGELFVGARSLRERALDADAVAQSVAAPLWCAEMFADSPPLGLLGRSGLVHDWALGIEGVLPPEQFLELHPDQRGRSPAQVAADVRAALAETRACTNT
ncbi:hypothetical protein [Pimelobacter sp. 30-1]|uniref:hypothetical protein n=1 Tax=Pimelobacter sp. 30-1 TaxID=2004991 RepID=UPI001C04F51D|nr:hypothetical protein [Pimelobacter sp. 30-1]MBU2694743.1 hypothetical protein [Pimelobacter sp. 30-1]